MPTERWVAEAKFRGEFVIEDQALEAPARPGQPVKKIEVTPEFDADGHFTGIHLVSVHIDIENDAGVKLPPHVVFQKAKDACEQIASLVSLSTGRPISIQSISVKHRLSETPSKHRVVIGQPQVLAVAPLTAFDPTVLTVPLDSKSRRIIRWWARGVAAEDGVDRLVSLTNALDTLASAQPGAPGRVRVCAECGHREEIGPGLREQVIAYLTGPLGYDGETAVDVYESRLDLAHGRTDLNAEDMQRFRIHANLLVKAVRDGLAERIGVQLPAPEQQSPFDLESAVLDVEYLDPPETPTA